MSTRIRVIDKLFLLPLKQFQWSQASSTGRWLLTTLQEGYGWKLFKILTFVILSLSGIDVKVHSTITYHKTVLNGRQPDFFSVFLWRPKNLDRQYYHYEVLPISASGHGPLSPWPIYSLQLMEKLWIKNCVKRNPLLWHKALPVGVSEEWETAELNY